MRPTAEVGLFVNSGGDKLVSKKYEQYLASLVEEYLPKHYSSEEVDIILDTPESELPLTGSKGLRKLLAAEDIEFFARAYFPDYLEYAVPKFHREMYRMMQDLAKSRGGKKIAIAAPRGHAKSTLWSLIFPIWCALYKKKKFIVVFSASSAMAIKIFESLKNELESNEYLLEDFKDVKGTIWKVDEVHLKNGCVIMARGSGGAVRGIRYKNYRPDLVILDDIEDDEEVKSPEQRRKKKDWFDRAVSYLGDEKTDITIIGTILHYDSLLNNIFKKGRFKTKKYKGIIKWSNSKLWEKWQEIITNLEDERREEKAKDFFKKHKQEMLAGTQVIWPERISYYDYQLQIVDTGILAFNCEIQNEPLDETNAWILDKDFHYYDDKDLPDLKECVVKAALDPSLGKSDKADPSAIVTIAQDKNGYLYVVESDAKIRRPSQIIQDLIEKQKRFNYQEVYVEAVQFQDLLADDLRKESAKAGVYINVVTEPKPTGDKETRIKSLEPMIRNGYVKFGKNQQSLIQELIFLGMWKHDDQADALHMAVQLFTQRQSQSKHTLMPMISGVKTNW